MRSIRTVLRGLIVVSVLLSALMLSAPAADAIESGPGCDIGTLTADNRCEIEGEPGDGECPSDAIVSPEGDCYLPVPAELDCEEGELFGDACEISVAAIPGPLECAEDFELTADDRCVRYEPPTGLPFCEVGELNEAGTLCVETGPGPVTPLVCPAETLGDPEAGCYVLVDRELFCEAGELVEGDCVSPIEAVPEGDFFCAVGLVLVVQIDVDPGCATQEGATYECDPGQLIDETTCLHVVPGELGEPIGELACDGPNEIVIDEVCYLLVGDADFSQDFPTCPEGQVVVLGEVCAIELTEPREILCPEGYDGFYDGLNDELEGPGEPLCELIYGAQPTCPNDDYDLLPDDICQLVVGPAERALVCPRIDADVFGTPPDCFVRFPAGSTCLGDSTPNDGGSDCRDPQDAIDGTAECSDDYGLVDGACIRISEPSGQLVCPDQSPPTELGCEIVGPDPTPGPSVCPETAFGEAPTCFELTPPTTACPAGTTGPDASGQCRQPVATGEGCAEGFEDVDGRCLRFEAAVWFCAGRIVTINMVLGDSGLGTSADDVILGTSGDDYIYGRSGRDYICGQGGNDLLLGGSDRDVMFGQDGADLMFGGPGNDYMAGGFGADEMFGNDGNDDVRGNAGDDDIVGGRGEDRLDGGGGNDYLRGGNGSDHLSGNSGFDFCRGGSAIDTFDTCESSGIPGVF